MISVFMVNIGAEVVIRHYETDSAEEACRLLVSDWIGGKIVWENQSTNEAYTREVLEDLLELELNSYAPHYKNGVRYMEWYYGGETNFEDELVQLYFIHPGSSSMSRIRETDQNQDVNG